MKRAATAIEESRAVASGRREPGRVLEWIASRLRGTPLVRPLRLTRSAADAILRAWGRPPLHVDLGPLRLSGYLRHRSFLRRLALGSYESELRRQFEDALSPGTCVVDGGAHIGLYTLLAAIRVHPGLVFAVEPDPYNFDTLRHNVSRAGLDNVILLNAALAESAGTADFFVSSGTVASSLIEKRYVSDFAASSTRTVTVDDILAGRDLPALVIKLDIEGAEPRALSGAIAGITRAERCRVILEHNPEALRDGGHQERAAIELLEQHGFAVAVIDEALGEVRSIGRHPLPPRCDLVADRAG